MKSAPTFIVAAFVIVLTLLGFRAAARESALAVVPDDAAAFVVVHNVADVNRSLAEVGKLLNAPPVDLLSMAKGMSGIQKGVDDQGDLILVISSFEPAVQRVQLVPVSNFGEFFSSLKVEEPKSGAVEVQLAGRPMLVGRKGEYAALAPVSQRESFEKFLASTAKGLNDSSLEKWLDANKVSLVVTSTGLKQVLPKLIGGIHMMQAQIRQANVPNGAAGAGAMDMYVDMFQAAQKEVDQFGLGLRIDSEQTVDAVSRLQFTPGGKWATWAGDVKPTEQDLLGGLEGGPFVLAGGGIVPQKLTRRFMDFSMKMMANQPMYHLSPEQAEKFAELSTRPMQQMRSMSMRMGAAEPGGGLYSNTTMVATVDDSKRYMDTYEKSLSELHEFLTKSDEKPMMPVPTVKRIKVGETDALQVSMKMADFKQLGPQGGPGQEAIMKLLAGPEGKLDVYVAPADERTVIMAYVSKEHLEKALELYRSKRPGLSADADVAKTARMLPQGSQFVGYASLNGFAKIMQQVMSAQGAPAPGVRFPKIPEFAESPPLGMAANVSATGVEGHFVVVADTLKAIGKAVSEARRPRGAENGKDKRAWTFV